MLNVTAPAGRPVRSSAAISEEISGLEADKAAHADQIERLSAAYDADLLLSEKAAERNEVAAAAARRGVRRAELRIAELIIEREVAVAAEREAAAAEHRVKAEEAVDAILSRIKSDYEAPAKRIAAFLEDLGKADDLAFRASVPSASERTRATPESVEPAHVVEEPYYVDSNGNEVSSEYPAGSFKIDDRGRRFQGSQLVQPHSQRMRTVRVPEKRVRGERAAPLTSLVNLPGARIDDAPFRVSTKHGEA